MKPILLFLFTLPALLVASDAPRYNGQGELLRPEDYREWIFLTSGLGMNYGPAVVRTATPPFDNVFVRPESYREFVKTGKWPDKTVFILEIRASTQHGSINKSGNFQTDLIVVEAAVKDEARFQEKWGYFGFPGPAGVLAKTSKRIPPTASCNQCHSTNAAVENTFVQFYPTLLEVAETKGTLNSYYKRSAPTANGFYHVIQKDGWQKAETIYKEGKQRDPEADLYQEQTLNRLGYSLLGGGKNDDALQVFSLVAKTFPASANAQDSLAECLDKIGKKTEALEATRKALALAESDGSLDADRKQRLLSGAKERLARLH